MDNLVLSDPVSESDLVAVHVAANANFDVHHVPCLPPELPSTAPDPSSSIIPFSRDPNFVPRGDILKRIHSLCARPAGRAALVGLGGVGKSQLAIEFSHKVRQGTPAGQPPKWIFWVNASCMPRVVQGFMAVADSIGIDDLDQPDTDVMQLVYNKLSDDTWGEWCMVLDGCDDPDVLLDDEHNRSLLAYLPQSRNGSIVVTTCSRDIAFRITGEHESVIHIDPMQDTEAVKLLENKLGSLPNPKAAQELVRTLDYFPLAISQAAAYIQTRKRNISLETYISEFKKGEGERTKLLNCDLSDLKQEMGVSNAVLGAWLLSFDYVRQKRPSAANLLSLMSFFNPQEIPGWLIERSRGDTPAAPKDQRKETNVKPDSNKDTADEDEWSFLGGLKGRSLTIGHSKSKGKSGDKNRSKPRKRSHQVDEETRSDRGEDNRSDRGDRSERGSRASRSSQASRSSRGSRYKGDATSITLREDISILTDYQLITIPEGGDIFGMHSLMRLSTRMAIEANSLREEFQEEYIKLLAKFFPLPTDKAWQRCQELLPHAEAALKDDLNKNVIIDFATLLHNAGSYALHQGAYHTAEKMLKKAVLIRQRKLGQDNDKTLDSLRSLSFTYLKENRLDKAEKWAKVILEALKSAPRKRHTDGEESVDNSTDLMLEEQMYKASKRNLGPSDPVTLIFTHSLAEAYLQQGQFDKAKRLHEKTSKNAKEIIGVNHPMTLTILHELAVMNFNERQFQEAEELFTETLEARKTVLGPYHPDTLLTMHGLALTYNEKCQLDKAENLAAETLDARENVLEVNNLETLESMHLLATIHAGKGQLEEAERLFAMTFKGRRRALGDEHRDTVDSMECLSQVLAARS